MKDEQVQKDLQEILSGLEIITEPAKTLLVVVAIHKQPERNVPQKVQCYHGTPIRGYAYEVKTDSYLIDCVEYKELGWINQTFYLTVPLTGGWKLPLPLPASVLERHLTSTQRNVVKTMRDKFEANVDIHFVQMQGCER